MTFAVWIRQAAQRMTESADVIKVLMQVPQNTWLRG